MHEPIPYQAANTVVVQPALAQPVVLPAQTTPTQAVVLPAQPVVLPTQPGPARTVPVPSLPVPPGPRAALAVRALTGPNGEAGLSAASIDDLLGPARGRYFGDGYRRVGHELRDVAIDADASGRGGVDALAWVRYPSDWAVKRPGVDLRPHVSSLDTLVISAQLCEAFLVHRYNLDPGQRRRMWLRRVDAKAGHEPHEELAGFEVTARLRDTRPVEGRPGLYASSFDCRIGAMRLRCEVGHEVTGAPPRPGRYALVDQLLGPAAHRYYGAGYRQSGYEIRDVGVDFGNTYAECAMRPVPGCAPASVGLEAEYQPCVTLVDSVVMTAQLSEVILYRTDGLDRSRSNTMWLRSLKMERPDPPARRSGARFSGSIAVSKSRVVELNGARWRIVDMVAYCEGIEQTHSLAHELPAAADVSCGLDGESGPGTMRPDTAFHGGFK